MKKSEKLILLSAIIIVISCAAVISLIVIWHYSSKSTSEAVPDDPVLDQITRDLQASTRAEGSSAKITHKGTVLIYEFPSTPKFIVGFNILANMMRNSAENNSVYRQAGFTRVIVKCGPRETSWALNPISTEKGQNIPLINGMIEDIEKPDIPEMSFVKIPAGTFIMGSNLYPSEQPPHSVTISKSFYMQTTEVTQRQWKALMGNNPSEHVIGENYPVENVSWDDVQEFLKRLNVKDPGKNYRLPTEAEWEYACRAGTIGVRYGNIDAIAWYDSNSMTINLVGQKQPNKWGLYDMIGNVREWCADWYSESYYKKSPDTDPKGPTSGEERVFRGGGFISEDFEARSAYRCGINPSQKFVFYGFRCAKDDYRDKSITGQNHNQFPATSGPAATAPQGSINERTVVKDRCVNAIVTGSWGDAVFSFLWLGEPYKITANGDLFVTRRNGEFQTKIHFSPNDFGWIYNLMIAEYQQNLLLVGSITDGGDNGAGFAMVLNQNSLSRQWWAWIPSLNVGNPLLRGHHAYVTACGFVGKIDLDTGGYIWKHENLCNSNNPAFLSFATPLTEGSTIVFSGEGSDLKGYKEIVVDDASGKILKFR